MAISAKTTLVGLLAALVLAPVAQAAEITEQPGSVRRTQIVQMEWAADAVAPQVVVERRYGLDWTAEADEASDAVQLEYENDGVWTVRWQPVHSTPAGMYRIRVEGADYSLTSDDFRVRPCRCVIPNEVRSRLRDGRFRVSMTAEYLPGPAGSLTPLPRWVTTGRPVIRVLRDGERIGSVRLRYRKRASRFRGSWRAPKGPKHAIVFKLISATDAYGNS